MGDPTPSQRLAWVVGIVCFLFTVGAGPAASAFLDTGAESIGVGLAFAGGVASCVAGVAFLHRRGLPSAKERPLALGLISLAGAPIMFTILFVVAIPDAPAANRLGRTLGGVGVFVLWVPIVTQYLVRWVVGRLVTVVTWIYRRRDGEAATSARTDLSQRERAALWAVPAAVITFAVSALVALVGGAVLLRRGLVGPGTTVVALGTLLWLSAAGAVFVRRRLPDARERPRLLGGVCFLIGAGLYVLLVTSPTLLAGPAVSTTPLREVGLVGIGFVWPLVVGQYALRWIVGRFVAGLGRVLTALDGLLNELAPDGSGRET